MSSRIPESELIINPDGSIYHLNILPEDITTDIITVGDPDRVDAVASRLDEVYLSKHKREFKTVKGRVGSRDITIISTGIGTDNIDIVFTELDALVNIDLPTRVKKSQHTGLRFYRLGTSGALRSDVALGTIIISRHAIGLESLMHFYDIPPSDSEAMLIAAEARAAIAGALPNVFPYIASASPLLLDRYAKMGRQGITVTATGFYGPQGRSVIAAPRHRTFLDKLADISSSEGVHTTNLEMETAGIYGMASLLGHEAISFNAILANRVLQTFSTNPAQVVDNMIDCFFEIFTAS